MSVVCFHWPHFWDNAMGVNSVIEGNWPPFYNVLFVFYQAGAFGVDFFFSLSGFIFYWKYADKVFRKEVSPKEFFILRFSRLYPLHALTLVLVAIMQCLHFQRYSDFFIFKFNDIRHFLQHVLLVPSPGSFLLVLSRGLEPELSFNGPVWSVSMEAFLYLVFFGLCVSGIIKARYMLLIALFGASLGLHDFWASCLLGRFVFSFFIGGLTFYGYRWVIRNGKAGSFLKGFILILPALIVLSVMEVYYNWFYTTFQGGVTGTLVIRAMFYNGLLFPVMLFTFALLDSRENTIGAKLSVIGTISYSSYLLHFPLQLFFILWIGNNPWLYAKHSVFLAYFFILISFSLGSYKYFEMPIQNAIRRKFL